MRRLPQSLYQIIGYDMAWKSHLTAKTGEGLLTNPVPKLSHEEQEEIDERLADALSADGELH